MQNSMRIIDLLADHELAFARLYKAYSEHFPDYGDFWRDLAAEEEDHADWIRRLQSCVEKGTVIFKEGRFNERAVQSSLQYAAELLTAAQKDIPQIINALSTSLWSERAMIEHQFFEVFTSDSAELRQTLVSLQEQTKIHIGKLENMLNEVKQRGY